MELAEFRKQIESEMAESRKENKRMLAESRKETDKKMDESRKRNDERNKSIDKLKELVGGMSNNQGIVAEEELFNSFSKSMRLGDLEFHSIDRNVKRHASGIQDEFDIVLTNSNLIMLVEVKTKFHPKDVNKVLNKISNFRKLFPLYQHMEIYGAIAGKILPSQTIETAKKHNLFVVAQEGSDLKVLNMPYKKETQMSQHN